MSWSCWQKVVLWQTVSDWVASLQHWQCPTPMSVSGTDCTLVHMMLYTLYTTSTVNTSLATITHSLRSCWLGPLDSSWLYPTSYTYLYINMITICKKCFILCKWLIMIRPHFARKDVVILRFRFRTRTGNFFCKIHHWELKYHKSSKNTLYSKLDWLSIIINQLILKKLELVSIVSRICSSSVSYYIVFLVLV